MQTRGCVQVGGPDASQKAETAQQAAPQILPLPGKGSQRRNAWLSQGAFQLTLTSHLAYDEASHCKNAESREIFMRPLFCDV